MKARRRAESLPLPRARVVAAAWVSLLAAACGDATSVSAPAPPREAVPVRIERVELRPAARSLTVPGLVEARSRTQLAFRVDGFVARFLVDEGERVEAGQVLAELDAADLERELRRARAALEHARARERVARQELERVDRLRAADTTSQERHDRSRADHAMAHSELRQGRVALETAEDRLAKAVLRAPLSATVERRLIEAHEPAAAGSPVLVLSELDTVTVRATIPDTLLPRLRVGTEATVRTPLQTGRTYAGRVRRIDVAADPATHSVPFEVEIENPEHALRPEQAVDVELELGTPEPLVTLPLGAVLRDVETQPFCFVVTERNGTLLAERRPVEVGAVHGVRVAIPAGLAAGERVIVRGQHFLRAGDPVRVTGE